MAFDQNIVYRASIDDSNFQAKLTQMRASIDSTVGGGGGGFNARSMGYVGPMMGNFGGGGNMQGGLADFGAAVAPVTYTPPAMAMNPHFGMFQIQQSTTQAAIASVGGAMGVALNGIRANGLFSQKEYLSPQVSYNEYLGYSTRNFADRMGAKGAAVAGAAAGVGADLLGGALGSGAAAMLGMGVVGSFAMPMLGGMALSYPVAGGVERAAHQIGIQSALESGSFRAYQGSEADPLTGRGFNRGARQDISRSIARMESNDSRFGMTDYRQILEGGMQMDLFSGTRDVDDFKNKFKGLVESVKTVSSTLHTTLKEGLETIRGMRDMGVTDPGMQQKLVMNTEVLARMSGKTGMEMMAVGQAGAEMFRGTGISMQKGFELNQQNTTLVQNMLNQRDISRETVAQMGGVNAAGQQMTASALSSFQTTLGRGTLMAAFNPATATLDTNILAGAGRGDTMSMMGRAAAMASSPGNMAKFIAHQEEMISNMSPGEMQAFSIQQTMRQARTMQQNFGGDIKDWYKTVGKQYEGKSEGALNIEMGILTMDPKKYQEQLVNQQNTMRNQKALEDARNSYMGVKYFTNAFTRTVTQPISEGITGAYNAVAAGVENFTQNVSQALWGGTIDTRQYNAASIGAAKEYEQARVQSKVEEATQGRKLSKEELAKETAAAKTALNKEAGNQNWYDVTDVSETGVVDWIGRRGGGKGTEIGQFLRDVEAGGGSIAGVKVKSFGSTKAVIDEQKQSGQHYNILGSVNGKQVAVADEDLAKMGANRRKMQTTEEEVEKQQRIIENKNRDKIMNVVKDDSVQNIGRQVVGEGFDMEKWMSGGYGKDTQAKMLAYAKAAHSKTAEEKINAASDTKQIDDVVRKVTSSETSHARAVRGELSDLVGRTGSSFGSEEAALLKDDSKAAVFSQAMYLVSTGKKADEDAAFSALSKAGVDPATIKKVIGDIKTAKKDDPLFKETLKKGEQFLQIQNKLETLNSAVAGTDTSKSGGVAGDTSVANLDNMKKLSDTLTTQIEIIKNLQASLQAGMKK